MIRGDTEHNIARSVVVGCEERPYQAAAPQLSQMDPLLYGVVWHHDIHWSKRFDSVWFGMRERIVAIQQRDREECPLFLVGSYYFELLRIAEDALGSSHQRLDATLYFRHLSHASEWSHFNPFNLRISDS